MIVQIHGTSGSGKSSLVYALMKWWRDKGGEVSVVRRRTAVRRRSEIIGYLCSAPLRRSIYGADVLVVGRYETPCGGCDGIGSTREIIRRVQSFAERGHVVFEGLLISSVEGAVGKAMKRYGDQYVAAVLDTPLETCLKRVNARRRARFKRLKKPFTPVNPFNTTNKWRGGRSYLLRAPQLGIRTQVLDHRDPLPGLLKLLKIR